MNPMDFQKRISKINEIDNKIDTFKESPEKYKFDFIDCNTIDIDLDIPIYRIVSFEELRKIFKKSSLSLSKPSSWEDESELFLFNNIGITENNESVSFNYLKNRLYCTCWSQKDESAALWKIYASKKTSKYVKIKSTPRKIMKYFYDVNTSAHYWTYFCGKVRYVETKNMNEILSNNLIDYFMPESFSKAIYSLFFKKAAFDYENEIRFVFIAQSDVPEDKLSVNKWDVSKKYFYFKIDINDIIEEIVFHPQISNENRELIENEIRKYDYKGKLYKSSLYDERKMVLPFHLSND